MMPENRTGKEALQASLAEAIVTHEVVSKADVEFKIFGRYLEENHWADKARLILRRRHTA